MLSELVPEMGTLPDKSVTGITDDSREVAAGDLFIAARGLTNDGRDFIPQALARAAGAVFCEPPVPQQFLGNPIPIIEVPSLSERKGEIASRFFGAPSEHMTVIAVTGTNGKTSCSQLISAAFTAMGQPCGVIGTLGTGLPGDLHDAGLTTPDAINLQRKLAALRAQGCERVALEASSHGLSQGRLQGTVIEVAVFTNITRDHLDFHETFEDYKAAKRSLFHWPGLKSAVINFDDGFAAELIASLPSGLSVVTYSDQNGNADVYCESVAFRDDGFDAVVVTPWGRGDFSSSLLGEFNVANVLAVISVLGLQGVALETILAVAGELAIVPGRMESIRKEGFPLVVIDYAHTPDALKKALTALRQHCAGDLWCVVGCGGDRDKGKRPEMGNIVAELSDKAVITTDNPRSESPMQIIEDMLAEVPDLSSIHIDQDRALAIAWAIARATPDDVVLIAGKGHEEYQEIGGKRFPFSDHAEVSKCFGEM